MLSEKVTSVKYAQAHRKGEREVKKLIFVRFWLLELLNICGSDLLVVICERER